MLGLTQSYYDDTALKQAVCPKYSPYETLANLAMKREDSEAPFHSHSFIATS